MLFQVCLNLNITPAPKEVTFQDGSYVQVGELTWTCTVGGANCMDQLENLKSVFTQTFFDKGTPAPTSSKYVTKLDITMETTDVPKSPMDGNETYKLVTSINGITIQAHDIYGVSRALATLQFLITEASGEEYLPGRYSIQSVTIKDYPTYNVRSLLVDAARHYLPLSTLKRQINGLALAKMNVLHIHIIDDESSAFAPSTDPAKNFEKAAYYTGGWYRMYMDSLKELAAYAHSMGVYMMIEVDMPGHAASWRLADERLVANCPKHNYSTVNPLNADVYVYYIQSYINDLVSAVWAPLGQTPLFHLGGDEVDTGCWEEDETISAYMAQKGVSAAQLWQQFHSQVSSLVPGKRVYWQESFENGNDMSNAIVESWYDESAVVQATKKGYKAIRAAGWYLDQNQPGASHYSFQDSWQDFYALDPMDGVST